MPLLKALNRRKLIPWLGAYLASGFLALEGVDQLIGNGLLPAYSYRIALVFYLFGIPGTLIIAWFHGEKGDQSIPRIEIWLQTALLMGAIGVSAVVVRDALREARAIDMVLASAAGGLDPAAVAVTYFEDLSPQGELAYVADGFTESLIAELARVRALSVVSANGVRPFRGAEVSRDSIARALGAGTLVTGTVERSGGDGVLVSTTLVDGGSGAPVVRMSVELPADELLAGQDSVADQVARALRSRIGEEIDVRQRQRATEVVEAWSGVQRAARLQEEAEALYSDGLLDDAVARFQRADELLEAAAMADQAWSEPVTLRAHNSFRTARVLLSQDRYDEADARIEEGIGYADEALSRSARSASTQDPRALETRGNLRYLRWLWELEPQGTSEGLLDAARADLEMAVQLDPTLASAHSSLSHMYYALDDNVNVVLAARRAYEEDAYLRDADLILDRLFWGHHDLEQFGDARRWCEEGFRRFPTDHRFTECRLWLLLVPGAEADTARARQLQAYLDSIAPADLAEFERALGTTLVAGVLARAGAGAPADRMMEEARLSAEVDPNLELLGFEAAVRSITGDTENAVRLLQRYVAGNSHHAFTSGGQLHWWWRPLRDEPGFQAVMETGH